MKEKALDPMITRSHFFVFLGESSLIILNLSSFMFTINMYKVR